MRVDELAGIRRRIHSIRRQCETRACIAALHRVGVSQLPCVSFCSVTPRRLDAQTRTGRRRCGRDAALRLSASSSSSPPPDSYPPIQGTELASRLTVSVLGRRSRGGWSSAHASCCPFGRRHRLACGQIHAHDSHLLVQLKNTRMRLTAPVSAKLLLAANEHRRTVHSSCL